MIVIVVADSAKPSIKPICLHGFWTDTVFDLLLLLKSLISLTLVDLMSSIVSVGGASLTLSHDSKMDDKLATLRA